MRKLFTFVGSILLMLLLAVIALPFLFPVEDYRDEILELVEEKTGRKVTINGAMNFTLLPNIAVEINDVTVGNPKGFVSPYFAKISTLHLRMALFPLLKKKIEVNELLIEKADIYLEEISDNKKNWEFLTTKIDKVSSEKVSKPSKSNFRMNIDSIVIEDTKLTYSKADTKIIANSLNINYGNNEAKLNSKINFAGTDYNITLATSNTNSLFDKVATPISFNVASPLINTKFSGELQGVNMSNGSFDAKLLGVMSARITGMATIDSSQFTADIRKANFDDVRISSAVGISAKGNLIVNYTSRKPHITADLNIPEINLNKLFPVKNKKASISFISDAYAAEGWSRDVVDLSALNIVNAKANISIAKLISADRHIN